MPMLEHNHTPRPTGTERPSLSIDAMSFADKVAAEYHEWTTEHRLGLYHFFARALHSYQKFLHDPAGYAELLGLDYIATLRQKPGVEKTSRLVLYRLTVAKTDAGRTAAVRYARVVDYLHQQGVPYAEAAKHVEDAGGMDAILTLARARVAPKDAGGDKIAQEDQEDDDEDAEETDLNGIVLAVPNMTIDLDRDAVITLKKELLSQILGDDTPMDKQFFLVCKKTSVDDQGRVRIVGKLWNPHRA